MKTEKSLIPIYATRLLPRGSVGMVIGLKRSSRLGEGTGVHLCVTPGAEGQRNSGWKHAWRGRDEYSLHAGLVLVEQEFYAFEPPSLHRAGEFIPSERGPIVAKINQTIQSPIMCRQLGRIHVPRCPDTS